MAAVRQQALEEWKAREIERRQKVMGPGNDQLVLDRFNRPPWSLVLSVLAV